MPPVDVVEEDFKTYFYPTKKGMDFQTSDYTWSPFDDDENVLPDWHLDPSSQAARRFANIASGIGSTLASKATCPKSAWVRLVI